MIDRVSRYVEAVLDEEAQPSTALGQFLLNTLALAPKVDPAEIERDLYVVMPPMRWYCKEPANQKQQQPHPRRSCCILPGQHHPNSDGTFQQTGHSTTDAGRWRIGVGSTRTTGQGWAQRTTTADAGAKRRGSSIIWFLSYGAVLYLMARTNCFYGKGNGNLIFHEKLSPIFVLNSFDSLAEYKH